MSFRAVAVALTVIFLIVVIQQVAIGPAAEIINALQGVNDYGSVGGVGSGTMLSLLKTWGTMGLIGIFGIMVWAVAWILRRETTLLGGNRPGGGLR